MFEEIIPMQGDNSVQATCPVFLHFIMLFQGIDEVV
jgi:hypothetical protein